MKKLYFIVCAVAIVFSATAQNELTNGGFETWTSGVPNGWNGSKSSLAASGISEYTSDAYEGSSALALFNASTNHKRFTNLAITATNEEYTLRYYAKGQGDIRTAFHDGNYSPYSAYTTFTGTEAWTLIESVFTPAAGPLEIIFSVRNGVGNGILIDKVVLLKTASLSADDFNQSEGFALYPNPTSTGFVNIKSAAPGPISVSLYDVLGKQVIATTVNNNRLNISSLASGVYVMQLNQNGALTTKKLVIK